MLTLSARTLLLHGIQMWPQMIDTMFWPFAFKAAAERRNCFLLNNQGLTQNAVLQGVPLDAIPVKTYHTLFCPVYVLDARAQSAGGPGPPKMGAKELHMSVPWSLSISCRKCCFGFQPVHQLGISTIPCRI
jgi:hypothetical protein